MAFNNAGVAGGGDFLGTPEEDWQWLNEHKFYRCHVRMQGVW